MPDLSRTAKRLEIAANVAIITLVFVIALVFWRNHTRLSAQSSPDIRVGSSLPTSLTNHQRTILLVLSTQCHFCTEGAPFYRLLVEQCRTRGIHSVAVFPQSIPEGSAYLSNHGITVDAVQQISPRSINVQGTPTLLMLTDSGIVEHVWVGKLASDGQQQVLASIDRAR